MSRKRKHHPGQLLASRRREQTTEDKKIAWKREKSIGQSTREWFFQHHPVFLFLLVFGVLMGLFYGFIAFTPYYNEVLLPSYHNLIAKMSGDILGLLGQDTTVTGTMVYSPRFSFTIIQGCDAVEATALFICGVLAFPAPFLRKVPGIIAGALLLGILNLVRIVSLFLIGVYFPSIFDSMHIDIWQALFIFFAITFWVLWLLWATQRQIPKRVVPS
jgi:exosortase H (IPTLxxWG-CTERM-specific)